MLDFTICLAGKGIRISCQYPSTRDYCTDYLIQGPEDFHITCRTEDLLREQELAQQAEPGLGTISPALLEQAAVYRKIADRMIEYDTVLFHGSVISVDGQGYLFTALSGTGKSTHTRLWRAAFGNRAVMVNDDKPLLRFSEDSVYACGTPWNGKHRLGTNIQVPLKGLCILNRGPENRIHPVTAREALPILLQQCYRPQDPVALTKVLALLDRLTQVTGLYCLECNMEPEAALVAYQGMNRKDDIL